MRQLNTSSAIHNNNVTFLSYREDCQAVRDLFCHREWSDLLTNKAKGVFLKSRAHLRLPDCARLPSRADSVCSSANLFDISLDVITSEFCWRVTKL